MVSTCAFPASHLLLLPQHSGWRHGVTSLPVAGDTQMHLPRAALLGVVRVPVIVHLGGEGLRFTVGDTKGYMSLSNTHTPVT